MLRATALPVFREIQKPTRTFLERPRRAKTTKSRCPADFPCLKTRSKSRLVFKVSMPRVTNLRLVSQSSSFSFATTGQHIATARRTHSFAKTVFFLTLTNFRLICPFHWYPPIGPLILPWPGLLLSGRKIPGHKKADDEYRNHEPIMSSSSELFPLFTELSTRHKRLNHGLKAIFGAKYPGKKKFRKKFWQFRSRNGAFLRQLSTNLWKHGIFFRSMFGRIH